MMFEDEGYQSLISFANSTIYSQVLTCNPSNVYVSSDNRGTFAFRFDIAAALASSFTLAFVAGLIYSDPKLRKHPNDLIALVFICDSFTFFQYASRFLLCGLSLSEWYNYIFAITAQYPFIWLHCKLSDDFESCWSGPNGAETYFDFYSNYKSTTTTLLGGWYFMTIAISYVSQFLMTATIYDMKLVLQNPFQSSQARINGYIVLSVVMAMLFTGVGLYLTKQESQSKAEWNLRIYQFVALLNCAFALYTMVWILIRFQKPGISSTLKREIRSRYLEFLVLQACFSWPICYITKPSYRWFGSVQLFMGGTKMVDITNDAWYFVILSSGILIGMSRFRDRLMQKKMIQIWYWITRKSDTLLISESDERAADLNTFLTTSLNTELVVTILKGIQIIAATSSDNTDNMTESDMLKVKQTVTIEIESIRILNAKKWEVQGHNIQLNLKGNENELMEEIMLASDADIDKGQDAEKRLSEWFKKGGPARDTTMGSQGSFNPDDVTVLPGATITAHATSLFQRLRLLDGIDYKQITKSLNPSLNRDQIFRSGEASGASGSFFFFSHDRRFIVKTMTLTEMKFIQTLLPDLYKHFKANPSSLLARIYGVYTVKMKNYDEVYLILMGNCLKFENRFDITRVYDLKGSKVKRHVKTDNALSSTTLKDVNFMQNKRYMQEVNLNADDARDLRRVLRKDSEMLAAHEIMDYSVLLGIENKISVFSDQENLILQAPTDRSETPRRTVGNRFDLSTFDRHRFHADSKNQTFHISVIDYLQKWDNKKKAEQFLKTALLGENKDELSAVEPKFYQQRFCRFLERHVLTKGSKKQSKQGVDLLGMSPIQRNRLTIKIDTVVLREKRMRTATYSDELIRQAKMIGKMAKARLNSATPEPFPIFGESEVKLSQVKHGQTQKNLKINSTESPTAYIFSKSLDLDGSQEKSSSAEKERLLRHSINAEENNHRNGSDFSFNN